jgi:hypothetical protein
MTKLEKLKDIYALIKAGNIVAISGENANGYVYITHSDYHNRDYIGWQCFGSSANRLGLNNLRWIVNTIIKSRSLNYKVVDSVYGNNEYLPD